MDVKKQLGNYLWLKKNLELLEDSLKEIDDIFYRGGCDGEKVIAKKERLEDKINQMVSECIAAIDEIECLISTLSEKEKVLMRLRYIHGYKWEKICVAMGYEWRNIHRIHSNAIQNLTK